MTSAPTITPPAPPKINKFGVASVPKVIVATIARIAGETGVQTHSRVLSTGLTGAGHSCLVQTPWVSNPHWVPIFALRPLLLKRLNKTWSTWWHRRWHESALRGGLIRSLRKSDVTAILAQCPVSARAALDAREKTGRDFPVVMVCHFNYSEATEYRDKGELNSRRFFDDVLAMEKRVMESVDRVVFVSHWARRVVEQDRGIRPRSSHVIWNGIPRDGPASHLKRSEIELKDEDLVMISVGTLEPRKNQLALIELLPKLIGDFPNLRLMLIGDGPSRRQIEARVLELKLESNVRLLGFRRDVSSLLPLADVYVHGSRLENCPMAVLEAARAGLPIVALPEGGVPELLEALGGRALDLQNPSALWELLRSPQQRIDAARTARHAFEQHFTREIMIAQYLAALQDCGRGGVLS